MKQILKFYGYLKKDITLLYKRKKYLYLFILLPILISSLFLFALNPSDYEIKLGICDKDNSELSQQSYSDLNSFNPIQYPRDNCIENLKQDIEKGKIDLGLEIPQGFQENIENLKQSKLIVYYDNTDIAFSNLIAWKLDASLQPYEKQIINQLNQELKSNVKTVKTGFDFIVIEFPSLSNKFLEPLARADTSLENLEQLETEFLVNPIWTQKQPIYNEQMSKNAGIVFVFPIIALFVILMLASSSILYDKKTNFITRVKSSSSISLYLLAKLIFFIALTAVQFIIILLLFILYGSTFPLNFIEIIKLIIYIALIDSLLGFIIGIISDNEGIAVLFSLILAFPLMLISGIFFPIQTLPTIVRYLAKILPLEYQINAAKSVLLFNQSISINWLYISLGLFIVVWYLLRKQSN